jgi:adenine-specific DNA-methyltransferase
LNKSSTTGVTGVLKGGFAPWYQLNGHMPICKADLKQPYLNTQLIAYIGNKRALLSFLQEIFLEISADSDTLIFFDPFAGSGSVSRLAKAMGFEVAANDWEPYAYAVNRCHVETEASELDSAFIGASCVHRAFDELNNLDHIAEEYIAKYYSPSSTSTADYRTERLFYTKENARFIDRIREAIESKYPEDDSIERVVLLASLIYQAATHANTSGVFKAYHRGFGGFGKDALTRIMKPMALQVPALVNGRHNCRVYCEDASRFVGRGRADICYLDPPYNQHQYGSNYHLLNTIALWDKPEPTSQIGGDGRLVDKAGIRKDWVKTRSPFCYRSTAGPAMRKLLDAIDARYIVVSYNTEGIIPFRELHEMLAESGSVSIRTSPYVTYRGGRQSMTRKTHNHEVVFVVDRNAPASRCKRRAEADRFILERDVSTLLRSSFYPDKIARAFKQERRKLVFSFTSGKRVVFTSSCGYLLHADASTIDDLADRELEELAGILELCRIKSRKEEALIITDLLCTRGPSPDAAELRRRLLRVVKKFAFKKYRGEFTETLSVIRERLKAAGTNQEELLGKLEEVESIAALRFKS